MVRPFERKSVEPAEKNHWIKGAAIGAAYGMLATVAGLLLSIKSFAICGSSGIDWAVIYFPYLALSVKFIGDGYAMMAIPVLLFWQYSVYGAIIGSSTLKKKRVRNALILAACHAVAVVIAIRVRG